MALVNTDYRPHASRMKLEEGKLSIKKFHCNFYCYKKHSNTRREPHHAFTPEEVTQIITFIQNFAEANLILLPSRIPGYKKYNIQLLPSSTSKRAVYIEYVKANATYIKLS